MSRRVLIVLFLVILLLFAVLWYLGSRQDRRAGFRLNLGAPSLQSIRRSLNARLESDEISVAAGAQAGCAVRPTGLVIPPGVRCAFTIRPSDKKNRQATFTLGGEGLSVYLELKQPQALTVDETLTPQSDPFDLDIFRNRDGVPANLALRDCQTPAVEEGDPLPLCRLLFKR
jgi:hypothetical protein